MAAAGPAGREATVRSQAALAALRGDVTSQEILELARRKRARARTGRLVRRVGLAGLVAGGAFVAWKWWSGQSDPDWLMEPSPATETTESRPSPDRGPESASESASEGAPGNAAESAPEDQAEAGARRGARG
ncbi:hypothetical protein D7294_26045 [Streptomyces hoynatensis]|uniref:Uncharacterized protein n=2 Tax=Streptomyces hoynatensis TaxID=1141874 RepID=A0A3A9YS06_9ACTN|nr:hypothetical protein D7294_26045 [Streptomyces hoynatensis]